LAQPDRAEEIETHYGGSPFIKEICVTGLADGERPAAERPYAVVVPNLELMRARKIVNVGDLLRFELEGLSHRLPPDQRVVGYEISFDPLPRTTTHEIDRLEVERRVRERRLASQQPELALRAEDREWLREPHAAAAVSLIQARARSGRVWPDANLELDLGLDSMERVELLTGLEQRFATRVPEDVTAEIFTVKHLVDAVRSAETRGAQADHAKVDHVAPWAAILRDLPARTDSRLGWLLRSRPIAAPVLFALLRVARMLFVRVRVNGLANLPESGPYLITPNHQSYVDPFILCGVLPYRVFKDVFFVGAVEYFETRFTRWVARTANLVPVDPDSNLIPAMQAGAFGLTHGKILLLFPEGERSIDGSVKKFKKGAPILAQHLRVPLIPVALKGTYELWPRNRGITWRLVAPWSGHRVRIEIGEPVTLPADATGTEGAMRVRERVNAMWQALSS
jgi:long-chain acyl-CoA synthetase